MGVYVLRRLAQTLVVLFVTSALVFAGLYLVGDPVEILVNPNADQEEKLRTAASPFATYLSNMHHRIHRLFADGFLAGLEAGPLPPVWPGISTWSWSAGASSDWNH